MLLQFLCGGFVRCNGWLGVISEFCIQRARKWPEHAYKGVLWPTMHVAVVPESLSPRHEDFRVVRVVRNEDHLGAAALEQIVVAAAQVQSVSFLEVETWKSSRRQEISDFTEGHLCLQIELHCVRLTVCR